MSEQLIAVSATYIRHIFSGGLAFLFTLIALVGALQIGIQPIRGISAFAWMAMYGPGLIALHFKQQIIHVRERRLPGATTAHVAVAALLLAFVALAIPALRMAVLGKWCFGFPGFVLAITAFAFAGILSQSMWLSFSIAPLIWLGFMPSVQKWIEELAQGQHESIGIALLGAGITSIAATFAWVLQLTEEDKHYLIRMNMKPSAMYRREMVETAQSEANKQIWNSRWFRPLDPADRAMQKWALWAKGSLWDRMNLWDVRRGTTLPTWIILALFPLFLSVPQYLISGKLDFNQPPNLILALLFPGAMIGGVCIQQWPMLAMESLKPIERKQLVIELGLTLARLFVVAWLVFSVAWFVESLLLSPDGIGTGLWQFLLLSLLGQSLIFSVTVWVLRYRTMQAWMAGFVFGAIFLAAVSAFLGLNRNVLVDPVNAVAVAIGVVLVSAVIIWDAYRRWLTTELG